MNSHETIEKTLRTLPWNPPPHVEQRTLADGLAAFDAAHHGNNAAPAAQPTARRRKHLLQAAIAAGLLAAAALALWFSLQPRTLYAQVMAALDDVRSLRIVGERYRDGQWHKGYEAWYEKGVGAAQLAWKNGTLQVAQMDDGKHNWRFMGGPRASRSASIGPKNLVARMLCIRERHPGWQRDPSGDRGTGPSTLRMYSQLTPSGKTRYRIWIDSADRIARFEQHERRDDQWQPDEQADVLYDVPIDREAWTRLLPADTGPDLSAADTDNLLREQFGLDHALATTEVLGLTLAVHKAQPLQGNRLFLVASVRPSQATQRELGSPADDAESWGDFQTISFFQRLPDGSFIEHHFSREHIAYLDARGIHVVWDIIEYTHDWPGRDEQFEFCAYVHTRGKLEESLKRAGKKSWDQFHRLLTVPLPRKQPLPTLEEAIESTYADACLFEAANLKPRLAGQRRARPDGMTSVSMLLPSEIHPQDYLRENLNDLARQVAGARK